MIELNVRQYAIISACTLLCGILFYAFYHNLIIIRFATGVSSSANLDMHVYRKNFKLYYVKDDNMQMEDKELLSSDDLQQTLKYVITGWLNTLQEEKVSEKKVILESVLVDAQGKEAFISFNQHPFFKELSIYDKLTWIESLFKTIADNGFTIQSVRFLVHHKPLHDMHLDFSQSWPISGFLNISKRTS